MQVPTVSIVTVVPATLHTLVVTGTVKLTTLSEPPPMAETVKVPAGAKVTGPGLAPKFIIWLSAVTVKVVGTTALGTAGSLLSTQTLPL